MAVGTAASGNGDDVHASLSSDELVDKCTNDIDTIEVANQENITTETAEEPKHTEEEKLGTPVDTTAARVADVSPEQGFIQLRGKESLEELYWVSYAAILGNS